MHIVIEFCPPFTETLRDPHQIQRLVFDLANSAKQEILMLLFPNTTIGDIFLEGYNKNVYKKQYSY